MSLSGSYIFNQGIASILVPTRLHIDPADGGHLIVLPNREVESRLELKPSEILGIEFCVRLASRTLLQLGYCDWVNIQENGNWALIRGEINQMHVHVYGRSKSATQQPFGESLRFPLYRNLRDWRMGGFTNKQMIELKEKCEELSQDSDSHAFLMALEILNAVQGDQ